MKKLIISLALLMSMIITSACGNMSISLGEYTFNRVHITTKNIDVCIAIRSWHDNTRGIEVETVEYGSIFLSEGTYILCRDKCPICAAKEGN